MTDTPPTVPLVMRSRLGELEGCWLEVTCQCRRITLIPLKLMVSQYGPQPYIGAILPRLKCKQCAARPVAAYLNETHNRKHNYGGPPGWSVQLIP